MKNEYDSEFEQTEKSNNGSMRWISLLVMAMVVFGFLWLILYAYNNDNKIGKNQFVDTISANRKSYKIKPEDAGGLVINNKDIESYKLMRSKPDIEQEINQIEKLTPLAERPITRNIDKTGNELQDKQNTIDVITSKNKTQNDDNEKIDNVDAIIDEVINSQSMQNQAAQKQKTKQQQLKEADNSNKDYIDEKVENKSEKIVTTPKSNNIVPPAKKIKIIEETKVAKKQALKTTNKPANNNVYIQLAALRSVADAKKMWNNLQTKYKELNNFSYYTEQVKTSTATLYRLRAKGFENRLEAVKICNMLKQNGQDCLVPSK